jgi:hypothetical protein
VYKATFDKVKLTLTSSQCHGTKFALRFRLHCKSLDLGDLARLAVTSSPIEVFSHLQYLAQAQEIGTRPATCCLHCILCAFIYRKKYI